MRSTIYRIALCALVAGTWLASGTAASAAADDEYYGRRMAAWERQNAMAKRNGWDPIFSCDYTSRRCIRGSQTWDGGSIVIEVLAEDRETVLEHRFCRMIRSSGLECYNVEPGTHTIGNEKYGDGVWNPR